MVCPAVVSRVGGGTRLCNVRKLDLGTAELQLTDFPARDPRVGDRVDLDLRTPGSGTRLSARAEIRWVSDLDARRFGVAFASGLRAAQAWAIVRTM